MPGYQISVVVEIEADNDEDAKALGANTRRVLGQYFPAGQVRLSVFGRPLDAFCRKVA